MSQDIADKPWASRGCAQGLVIAGWIEGEFAEERAVLTDNPDVLVGDEEENGLADVSAADADVVQATKARAGSRGPPCRSCRGGGGSDPPVRHQRRADLPRRCREVKDEATR
jgi:hypothetical protein